MKFVEPSHFTDPGDTARKLAAIANATEAAQDGRIYIDQRPLPQRGRHAGPIPRRHSTLTRSSSDQRPGFNGFAGRRIDLRDPEKAIGLGIVRPGDKRSAHFCAVPAGYDAKPKRLFCLNVTRRKILHEVYAFKLAFDLLSSAERFPAVR